MASLPLTSLKHISSIAFDLAPLSASPGARSARLLLARLPSKAPPGMSLPEISARTVSSDSEIQVTITYSDKQTAVLKPGQMGIQELLRKVEAPARVLRLKEEGL